MKFQKKQVNNKRPPRTLPKNQRNFGSNEPNSTVGKSDIKEPSFELKEVSEDEFITLFTKTPTKDLEIGNSYFTHSNKNNMFGVVIGDKYYSISLQGENKKYNVFEAVLVSNIIGLKLIRNDVGGKQFVTIVSMKETFKIEKSILRML